MAAASPKYLHWLLNFATVTATIGALTVVVERVHGGLQQDTIFEPRTRDLRILRRHHPRDVAVVYRHFPLTIIHPHARVAALAAECGAREGVVEALHDRLYDEPDSIGLKPWTRFALEAGVTDTTRFVSCMNGAEAKTALSHDSVAAARLGVVATPTLLINELKFEGSIGLKRLKASVARALQRARP